jgi:hypothetical protein
MSLDYLDDSSDIYIDLGANNVPASTGELTVTGWSKVVDGTSEDQVIIAKTASTGNTGAFRMQLEEPDNEVRGIINDNELTGTTTLADIWAFVAMVYDGSDKTLFINAVQEATEADSGGDIDTNAEPLLIGALDDGTIKRQLDGLLADIRVYTRALSVEELLTIYNSLGVDGIVHGLLWRWPQNELSPGTAATISDSIIDLAGNLNGDPMGSPVYETGILRIS